MANAACIRSADSCGVLHVFSVSVEARKQKLSLSHLSRFCPGSRASG